MMRFFLLFPLIFFALLTACAPPTPEQNAITALYNTMTPYYVKWREASAVFATTTANFCANKADLGDMRTRWRQSALAWHAIQAFPIGPVNDKGYASQVAYWPDPKNLVAFQVESRLKNSTPPALASSSVALRGLSAAEYILFDRTHDISQQDVKNHYCPLLNEIGTYQATFSLTLEQEWQQFSKQTQKFPNERFANEHEALTEFLRTQVTALDNTGKRLAEPFKTGQTQIYQLEYWRSGLSQASLYSMAQTHEALWRQGWRTLALPRNSDLATSIDQTYVALLENLSRIPLQPLSVTITKAEGVAWVRSRQSEWLTLDKLYGHALAKTLGIQIGFNANDGD